jgi:chromosome segregation and condensation protein ScpB
MVGSRFVNARGSEVPDLVSLLRVRGVVAKIGRADGKGHADRARLSGPEHCGA